MLLIEAQAITPYGSFDYEIRRRYTIFGITYYLTEWFRVSKLWPSMTLTLADIKRLDIKLIKG